MREDKRSWAARADEGPPRDPSKHYLSLLHYEEDSQGQSRAEVITLEQEAADLQGELDNDRAVGNVPAGGRDVTITELRAMIIGQLLQELAERLSPGPAFGPGTEGLALAQVARQLSDELLSQTFVG